MGDVGIVVDPAVDPTLPPSQEINVLVTGFGVRIQTSPCLDHVLTYLFRVLVAFESLFDEVF